MLKRIEIEGEKIYLNKSKWFGWKVVKPIRNEDGSINWKNLLIGGSWFNLIFVILIIAIVLGCVYEYSIALKTANECLANNRLVQEGINQVSNNFSNIKLP